MDVIKMHDILFLSLSAWPAAMLNVLTDNNVILKTVFTKNWFTSVLTIMLE
jgi:hypothetical protein